MMLGIILKLLAVTTDLVMLNYVTIIEGRA